MSDFDTLSSDLDQIATRDAALVSEINDLRSQLVVAQQSSPVDLLPLIEKADNILAIAQTPVAATPTPVETTTEQTSTSTDTTTDQPNVDTAAGEQADTTETTSTQP